MSLTRWCPKTCAAGMARQDHRRVMDRQAAATRTLLCAWPPGSTYLQPAATSSSMAEWTLDRLSLANLKGARFAVLFVPRRKPCRRCQSVLDRVREIAAKDDNRGPNSRARRPAQVRFSTAARTRPTPTKLSAAAQGRRWAADPQVHLNLSDIKRIGAFHVPGRRLCHARRRSL